MIFFATRKEPNMPTATAGRAAGPVSLADMDEALADEAGARAARRGKHRLP
jgi:hypothetical protein